MSTAEVEKTVKIIPFTSKSVWSVWSKQFLARAHLKGYKDVVVGKVKALKWDANIDMSTEAGKKQALARKANEAAYNDLLLSFEYVTNFHLVDQVVTGDLPDGDAAVAWKNLLARHEPSTAATKVRLKLEFNQSKLSDGKKDPEEWISKLEVLRIKLAYMGSVMSDEDMIIHFVNNLPEEYEVVTDQLESDLNKNANLGLEEVKERLQSK